MGCKLLVGDGAVSAVGSAELKVGGWGLAVSAVGSAELKVVVLGVTGYLELKTKRVKTAIINREAMEINLVRRFPTGHFKLMK